MVANRSGRCFDALAPLAAHELVAEVRGGVGTMAAVELTDELRDRQPRLAASLALAVRAPAFRAPGGTAIAVSPLTAGPEHFEIIAQAIEHGLNALCADRLTVGSR